MGSIIKRIKKGNYRIFSQVAALAVLNLYFLQLKSVCIPAFNCHSCPAAVFACPIGVLVNFSSLRIFPFVTLGILGLVGTVAGRWTCGWLCPFGLLQDGLYRIPSRKINVSPGFARTKYIVLIGLVIIVPFLFPNSLVAFCRLCPAGTLESMMPWRLMGVTTGYGLSFYLRVGTLAAILVLMIMLSRGFCRLLCPLGAIFALFNKFSLFKIRLTAPKCNSCGTCARKCPVEIDPVKDINSPECVRCLECTSTEHLKFGLK